MNSPNFETAIKLRRRRAALSSVNFFWLMSKVILLDSAPVGLITNPKATPPVSTTDERADNDVEQKRSLCLVIPLHCLPSIPHLNKPLINDREWS